MLVYKENTIPAEPPHRIILSDGSTRTDATSFTEEELIDAGYSIAPPKPRIIPGDSEIRWNTTTGQWDIVQVTVFRGAFGWHDENNKVRNILIEEAKFDRLRAIEKGEDRTPYDEHISTLENLSVEDLTKDPTLIEWPQLVV